MIQLRHLEPCVLYRLTKTKQENGTYINTYEEVGSYEIQAEELTDNVSISIYGARIVNMYRFISPYNEMVLDLAEHMTQTFSPVSDYQIGYNNKKYRIVSVRKSWVEVELISE